MTHAPVKRASTFFLKAVIILIGAVSLAICAFSFLPVWQGGAQEVPAFTHVLYPGLIGIYATILPFLFALSQAFTLLHAIDNKHAFSERSVTALRNIKYAAVTMTVLYAIALPLAFVIAQLDDAPGLVLMASAVAGAPLVVATFAAVLQKLVRQAVDMQAELDATV